MFLWNLLRDMQNTGISQSVLQTMVEKKISASKVTFPCTSCVSCPLQSECRSSTATLWCIGNIWVRRNSEKTTTTSLLAVMMGVQDGESWRLLQCSPWSTTLALAGKGADILLGAPCERRALTFRTAWEQLLLSDVRSNDYSDVTFYFEASCLKSCIEGYSWEKKV